MCFGIPAIAVWPLITAMKRIRPPQPPHCSASIPHTRCGSVGQRNGVRPHTSATPADGLRRLDHERAACDGAHMILLMRHKPGPQTKYSPMLASRGGADML